MQVPFSEMIKSIPGAVGIRLEEELPYTVIRKVGDIELRKYEPFTLAQVTVQGTWEEASDEAFKKLASFIFGENEEHLSTSMTTPVFMDKVNGGWMMSFYLSEEESKIHPIDPSITIEYHQGKTAAVYSYSGVNNVDKMEEAKAILLKSLKTVGLKTISDVWWAQFDQPISLPMTKRNEALVKVELD